MERIGDMDIMTNYSIMSTTRTVAQIAGVKPPRKAECANEVVVKKAAAAFKGLNADRVFLYNPDAIAHWLFRKYTRMFDLVFAHTSLQLPIHSVMPSVTPVCFASMYTGVTPEIHGINAYIKPVLKTQTLFDAYIQADKKPAIVSTTGDSISKIFLERQMDYFIYDTPEECNEKALDLIQCDGHDLIVLYNGDYDVSMHRNAPESDEALAVLRKNIEVFSYISDEIKKNWRGHRTLLGFLPDHGCHEIDGKLGSHGLDMPEDMEIIHMYGFISDCK